LSSFKDRDRDRVPNIMDCRPRNPRLQGIRPSRTMTERLMKLPIYVTERPAGIKRYSPRLYHITEKKAPKRPKQRFLSIIKKHPGIIGEIERKKPVQFVVTTAREKADRKGYERYGESTELFGEDRKYIGSEAVVRLPWGRYAKPGKRGKGQGKGQGIIP